MTPQSQFHLAMEGDESLFGLLSSQQELINPIDMEIQQPSTMQQPYYMVGHLQSQGLQINTPITDMRSNMDVLHPKRFSLDFGASPDNFPAISFHETEKLESFTKDDKGLCAVRRCDDINYDPNECGQKKRRLSSLGFLGPSFFEDHAKPVERRNSQASAATFESAPSITKTFDDDDKDDEEEDTTDVDVSEVDYSQNLESSPVEPVYEEHSSILSVSQAKAIMSAFTEAMAESQKSQQAIHDWDRKMGLKRSHSKTMRLSMRSRKKLKLMVKKDVNAMSKKE